VNQVISKAQVGKNSREWQARWVYR